MVPAKKAVSESRTVPHIPGGEENKENGMAGKGVTAETPPGQLAFCPVASGGKSVGRLDDLWGLIGGLDAGEGLYRFTPTVIRS